VNGRKGKEPSFLGVCGVEKKRIKKKFDRGEKARLRFYSGGAGIEKKKIKQK
jgi:hypothetical protein